MYQIMYYGGLFIGISALITSVILFIKLNIRQAFLEVSGLEAKRAIKQLQGTENRKEKKPENPLETKQEHTRTMQTGDEVREQTLMDTTQQLDDEGETVLLHEEVVSFYVEEEHVEVHTDEVIKERDGK